MIIPPNTTTAKVITNSIDAAYAQADEENRLEQGELSTDEIEALEKAAAQGADHDN